MAIMIERLDQWIAYYRQRELETFAQKIEQVKAAIESNAIPFLARPTLHASVGRANATAWLTDMTTHDSPSRSTRDAFFPPNCGTITP